MKTLEALSFASSLIALLGLVWRAATEQERLKSAIKDNKDDLQHQYDIELERIKGRIDKIEYLVNHNRELIEHRSARFGGEIKDIRNYLQTRFDFRIRGRDDHDNATG